MAIGFFESCHICKPPKRHTGCHDHCKEYAEEKARHEAYKEAERQQIHLDREIYRQKSEGIHRATKKHRKRRVPRNE